MSPKRFHSFSLKLPESAIQNALEFLNRKRALRRDGDAFFIDQLNSYSCEPSAHHVEASLLEPAQRLPAEHPKILRLIFRMLMLVDMAPVEERALVEFVLQEAGDC